MRFEVLFWRYVCACLTSHPSLLFPSPPGCVCALAQFLMLGAQTALFMWKKRHQKSYDLVGKGSMGCWVAGGGSGGWLALTSGTWRQTGYAHHLWGMGSGYGWLD